MATHTKVTLDHLTEFGGIIHIFAKLEFLVQATTAGLVGVDLLTVLAFTSDLNYRAKKDCVLNLARIKRPDVVLELETLLDAIDKKAKLRNFVGHSIWCAGKRPGAIKPIGLQVRGGTPKLIGVNHNEKEWTAQDLRKEAAELEMLHSQFRSFLDKTGLAAIIDQKIDEASLPRSADTGRPFEN